jgi:hypothetical protein
MVGTLVILGDKAANILENYLGIDRSNVIEGNGNIVSDKGLESPTE